MSYREEIGAELQTIRVQKGLTVRELGEICGMQHSSIVKIENGKYNVSVDILGKVAEALGMRLTFAQREGGIERRLLDLKEQADNLGKMKEKWDKGVNVEIKV